MQDQQEQIRELPKYHLTRMAISQIWEIARGDEDVEAQVLADLDSVGESPTIGIELDPEYVERAYGNQLSHEELEKLKRSRVFKGDKCTIRWTVEALKDGQCYSAIWSIELLQEDEKPEAMPEYWRDWMGKSQEVIDETLKKFE